MNTDNDYNNRQLIPRLLPSSTSNLLSLNINTNRNRIFSLNPFEIHNYQKLITEWATEKNIILATQILTYEIINDSLTINPEILLFLNNNKNVLNLIENDILNLAIKKNTENYQDATIMVDQETPGFRIKALRLRNNKYCLNPLQWCDIGFYYTKLGLIEKAKKAYLIAISLNNNNRHVVRSVARFFLHYDDVEQGHYVLAHSPRINNDSGIISAEIAFSEIMRKKSKFINRGIQLADDDNISLQEKNELLSQLATLEFSHGKTSKGRKLIERSFITPTENTLAQIAFLRRNYNIDQNQNTEELKVLCQYEAVARTSFYKGEFETALNNAKDWHQFQPFSHQPVIFYAYTASTVFSRYTDAIETIKSVLNTSSNNFILLNNLAYSYARNNQVAEAIETQKKIKASSLDEADKAVFLATNSLIAFKNGDSTSARKGYNEAIQYFRKQKKGDKNLALCLYNYSLVLFASNKNEYSTVIKEVEKLSKQYNILELKYLLNRSGDTL